MTREINISFLDFFPSLIKLSETVLTGWEEAAWQEEVEPVM